MLDVATVAEAKRAAVVRALSATHGNKRQAADLLMIGRSTLRRWHSGFEIRREEYCTPAATAQQTQALGFPNVSLKR